MVYQQYVFNSDATSDPNAPMFNMGRSPHVAKFKILSVNVPLSFYTTGRHNNTVAIRENGTVRYVTLTEGSYNAATFPSLLQNALGSGYFVTYNESQRSLKIDNANVSFSILGMDGGTTAYSQLGARRQGESTPGNSWRGGVANLTGTSGLLLVSSELFTKDVCFANVESVNCLAMIELNTPQNSYMLWENKGGYVDSDVTLSYCRFRFLDSKTLNEVDFRGAGYTIQLGVLTDSDDPVTFI